MTHSLLIRRMWIRRAGRLCATIAMIAVGTVAHATNGGPELLEVLGWEPKDHKVFVAFHHVDESADEPTVGYFDFGKRSPTGFRVIECTQSGPGYDSVCVNRIRAIRGRVRPLAMLPTGSIVSIRILATDTLKTFDGPMARYRLETRFEWGGTGAGGLIVEAFPPRVRMLGTN